MVLCDSLSYVSSWHSASNFNLVLNLTVAIGTLNGIILYANIVAANNSTFLPFTSSNFITVFIAWLNLDFGIDTCATSLKEWMPIGSRG